MGQKIPENKASNPSTPGTTTTSDQPAFLPKSFHAPSFKLTVSKEISNNEEVKAMENEIARDLKALQLKVS